VSAGCSVAFSFNTREGFLHVHARGSFILWKYLMQAHNQIQIDEKRATLHYLNHPALVRAFMIIASQS
jgi:hypothetical protein